ncbi:MFS transporter [Thermocrispum municipale]|uniref:MFS transporter n=1 Tax=Thermocrispum municipale TaxID=37926 RepID=UPI00041F5CBA|nr:MFS transporter [Thermocrispum municipale]
MGRSTREQPVHPERSGAPTLILALACAAQLMVVLDVSVINVALPAIHTDLTVTPESVQWVSVAYLLSFGGFLLLGGRLADVYGQRSVFLAGLVVFVLASLTGGSATNLVWLIAARFGQGFGAAILAPTTLTLLTTTFDEGPRRTRALAAWTAVSVAGGAVGNLLGGALTEYLSWRATLLINVPIGGAAMWVAWLALARDDAERRGRLDIPGGVLATLGLAAVTYAISRVEFDGWKGSTVVPLAAGVVLLAAFILVERRTSTRALLPLGLFRIRNVAVGNAVMLLIGACFQAPMWYFLTFYMQDVLEYGAAQTGLGFLPHTLTTVAVGWWMTPWLMRHAPARVLVITGALVAAGGFVWQSTITPNSSYLIGIVGPGLVFSFGVGVLNTPLTTIVTSGIPAHEAGAASGLMNTTKQVGGALGLSALVTVASGGPEGFDYRTAFLVTAAILLVAAAAATLLPRGARER